MSKPAQNAKPCPFCGGTNIRTFTHEDKRGDSWWNIFCHDCSAELKYHDNEDRAILSWNRRVPTPITQEYSYWVEGTGAFGGVNFQLVTTNAKDEKI